MEQQITVKELIESVIARLGNITGIPVSMANDVARPIWEAIEDLKIAAAHIVDAKPEEAEEVKENV